MKRFVAVIVITVLACLAASLTVHKMRTRQPPAEWLGKKLGLEGVELAEFTAAHHVYAISCAEMCQRIEEANNELEQLVLKSPEISSDIVTTLSRVESLRAECKQNMLTHFMKVAKLLDEEKQKEYMQLVMPLITERDQMEKSHEHHH